MSGLTCFTTLPEELHILILSFLDHPRHLLTVSAVNGHFHRLVGDDILWHALFLQYDHKRTPYEEQSSIPFKVLFKQRFVLDQNWNHSVAATGLQSITTRIGPQRIPGRALQALAAVGGHAPVMAVAYPGTPILVYNLKTKKIFSALPDEDVRALVLVLDVDRERDELVNRRQLTVGISRGWGDNQIRIVTGNKNIKVWTLPHREEALPLIMEVKSQIRCMRGVDRTSLLLTGSITGSVKLWDIKCGKLVRNLERFNGGVLCLDLQSVPGEKPVFIAAGGSKDHTAKIWNLKTGEAKTLHGHQLPVHHILVDETIVVTGGMDSTIRTWRLDTGEQLSLLTTHKTVVSRMFICTSPFRSLLTICFDGIAAIHTLDEEVHTVPATPRGTTRLNLTCSTIVDAGMNGPYLVIGGREGMLSLFRLEPQDDPEGESDSQMTIRPIRAIPTGFTLIHRICVLESGIIVGGYLRHFGPSFLYYNFALEEQPH